MEPIEPGLTVAAVARRIGVAPDTLRTWDRRYGMGPSQHVAGKHRRYTAADVARIEIMSRLIKDGVMPAEAARVAQNTDVSNASIRRPALHLVTEEESLGVNVVDFGSAKNTIKSIMNSANALDDGKCGATIARTLESKGVIWTWDNVLVPVLTAVGEKWATTGEGVEVEHLLAEVITDEMRTISEELVDPINARPVLLLSAPHELHTLPIYAIEAVLAQHQIAARMFGARLPGDALTAAVRRIGPSVIVAWSSSIGTADVKLWTQIEPTRPAPLKIAVGPGWGDDLPSDVKTASNLAEVTNLIIEEVAH